MKANMKGFPHFPWLSPLSNILVIGVCVRCDAGSVYMHHKFAVVDGRQLITGSLNWTLTAVQSNMENIIITEEAELVQPFIKEFNQIWALNDPAQLYKSY